VQRDWKNESWGAQTSIGVCLPGHSREVWNREPPGKPAGDQPAFSIRAFEPLNVSMSTVCYENLGQRRRNWASKSLPQESLYPLPSTNMNSPADGLALADSSLPFGERADLTDYCRERWGAA
jgi:hypothetical protein